MQKTQIDEIRARYEVALRTGVRYKDSLSDIPALLDFIDFLKAQWAETLDENDDLKEKMHKIEQWCTAYPVDVFPEMTSEDFSQAHEALVAAGYSMDRVSANISRRILSSISEIIGNKTEA
jgi:hypothetical protein